jgi:hypothetical protein
LGTFWLKIEQFWPFEEISIFSNSDHLEWRAGLSDTILKGTHPARFGLIWLNQVYNPRSNTLETSMLTITPLMGFYIIK